MKNSQTGAIGTIYKKGVAIEESLEEELSKLLVEKFGAVPKVVAVPKGGVEKKGGFRAMIGGLLGK